MVIGLNEAKKVLEPILPPIFNCISSAIREYKDTLSCVDFSKRTRASIINDLIIKHAYKDLLTIPGIIWRYKKNSFYIIIMDKFKLKFKMLDNNLKTKNIPTQQVFDFINQNEQLEFPDSPQPVTNIIAGYKWNILQTDYDGIYIVCPNGSRNEWMLNLAVNKAAEPAEIIPLQATKRKRRVVPRKVDDNDKNIEKQ